MEESQKDDKGQDEGLVFSFNAKISGRLGRHAEKAKWTAFAITVLAVISGLLGLTLRVIEALQ